MRNQQILSSMAGIMRTVVLLQPAGERCDLVKLSCSCCMQFIELVLSWSVINCHCRKTFWNGELIAFIGCNLGGLASFFFFLIQLTSKLWSDVDNKWCYFLLPNNSFRERYHIVISFLWVNNFILIKLEQKFPLWVLSTFSNT